ncbi:MAG: InlB B-repeat-containing protein [Treponema sp.]
MKISNSKIKAFSTFLGAAFMLLIALAGCNQAGTGGGNSGGGGNGGGGTPTPPATKKHDITFSVEGTNGMLTAKAEGVAEPNTSPINVEEGKEVTFTAKANDGYRVKEWKLGDKPITKAGINTEYKHTVTGPATITVSFESKGTSPTPSVEGKAILTLDPNKLTIRLRAKTADALT